MTPQTSTDTQTAPFRRPARPTKMQVWCGNCTCLQQIDEGIGWCVAHTQYRSLRIDRDCGEFHTQPTED